jgi:peroxisomal 2,4-dienoyl-CoA reductase
MSSTYESPFKSDILQGKVALITGGASGIGYEITRQLALHGASVSIMGRRIDVLKAAVQSLVHDNNISESRVTYVQGDVRNSADCVNGVEHTVKTFNNGLDILVNCAAGNFLTPAEDLSPKGFKTVIEIDTIGTFNCSHAAFPYLKQSQRLPCIINISALLHKPATWYQVHASAAKAAVDSLTRSLALEWGEYGIRVNGIAPGPIAETTGMSKLAGGVKAEEHAKRTIPMQRWGVKQDIALACVYLNSQAANWITGDTLAVDGGNVLYRPPVADREVIRQFSRAAEKSSKQVGLPSSTQPKSKL